MASDIPRLFGRAMRKHRSEESFDAWIGPLYVIVSEHGGLWRVFGGFRCGDSRISLPTGRGHKTASHACRAIERWFRRLGATVREIESKP